MNKDVEKKLRIENLTRCMNCSVFATCSEKAKEDIVCCAGFVELDDGKQVVVILLTEYCRLEDGQSHKAT